MLLENVSFDSIQLPYRELKLSHQTIMQTLRETIFEFHRLQTINKYSKVLLRQHYLLLLLYQSLPLCW